MIKPAVAFDYEGKDRALLLQHGHWLVQQLGEMGLPEARKLAVRFSQGSYMELIGLARRLTQPGLRLVLFEDVAFRLHALVVYMLERTGQDFDSPPGRNAAPLLNDVAQFMSRAQREVQSSAAA